MHNGIIENHEELRSRLQGMGYEFSSDTDTEVIAHLVHHELKSAPSLLAAMQVTVKQLRGAYGTVVMDSRDDSRVVVARSGSPGDWPRHRRELHRLRPDGPAAGDPPLHLP